MAFFRDILQFMFTPKLHRIYGNSEEAYKPTVTEKFGEQVLTLLHSLWNFGLYTSPVTLAFIYRRGYFIAENLATLTKFLTSIGVILVVTFCMKGYGRANSVSYKKFTKALHNYTKNRTVENHQQLSKYDFDFYAWPIDFKWSEVAEIHPHENISIVRPAFRKSTIQCFLSLPCQVIAYVAMHTFGIYMIYPGSLSLLQMIISSHLEEGRSKLVNESRAKRFKLQTRDNNYIDTMFVDKRKKTDNGTTLIVCCEGNAGFYEIGIMGTPIEKGYSVLGWNHPGFGGSTGTPYPAQEQNAIDVVLLFAIHNLQFKIEDIILYGWSIGGYSASWAAMNYNVKGIILDATFDDVLPIALQQMPSWWESIVHLAIRDHVNLNNYEQLCRYNGPILLIRRTEDEVIFTIENNTQVNRGNFLLVKLMKYRYPYVFGDEQVKIVKTYLKLNQSKQDAFRNMYNVDMDLCNSMMQSYILEHSKTYPMHLGENSTMDTKNQLALFLVHKYMKDYASTHCTPLPKEFFEIPWDVNTESDYVFT